LDLDGKNGAFGSVLEDETGKEEARAEEVDAKCVEDAGALSVSGQAIDTQGKHTRSE
jgi:hypothetical protein